MRDIPELTFRTALNILGQYDRPVLERLSTALGGAIMIGGAVALTGPVAMPLVGAAALWGWVDQKNEAVGLVRKLLDKIGDHRTASRGYNRTRLIAAAHTVLVASSVIDAFRYALGETAFKSLAITDKELATLLPGSGVTGQTADVLYNSTVPLPSSGRGFGENLPEVAKWQKTFATALVEFCAGLSVGEKIRDVSAAYVAGRATRHYEDRYHLLAAKVPEFVIWAMLNEHAATRTTVANIHKEVHVAFADQAQAMSRLESLLTAVAGSAPDQIAAVHRATQAGLDEPVVPRDASTMSVLPDIVFPLVHEIFVQPHYRYEQVGARSRVADEQWWKTLPTHDDLDIRLTAHLSSAEATRLPLLLLGHPGAGKSLLMKVLAARMPADQYTTVYVPLRHVSGTDPVYEQIEQALARETHGRATWANLAHQSQDTLRVVLLDGLDEMLQAADRDRANYLHDVTDFQWRETTQQRPVVVLVTSRTLVADRVDVPRGTTVIKLEEFTDGQVDQWRSVWNSVNRAAIDAGSVRKLTHEAVARQSELARQPLLLLMLALYSADPSFPAVESGLSRTALYRTLLENFTRREATKLPETAEPRNQLLQLSIAAIGMFNRGRQHISDVELAADLAALGPAHDSEVRKDSDLRLVAQFFFVHTSEADLETDRARRSYEFLHATFGEYLVAREIVDTLVDSADSSVGRRGIREPDDDRMFALLSHDCMAVRGPILEFIGDLLAEQPPEDLERIWPTVTALLASARRRQGSSRYSDYRPTGTDHVRALAAYTANLALLGMLLAPGEHHEVSVDELMGDAANWHSMLYLWRAGLVSDSWHALLATLERTADILYLSSERIRSTGLEADLRHAELAEDTELLYTLRMGRAIRDSMPDTKDPYGMADLDFDDPDYEFEEPAEQHDAEREELLGWLAAMLAFGDEPDDRPMHQDRLIELFQAIAADDHEILTIVAMVLKQRAHQLSFDVARELVAHLLTMDSHDSYAFIASIGAHPGLLTEFPGLGNGARYAGMQGAVDMMAGTVENVRESRARLLHLLDITKKRESSGGKTDHDPAVSTAALLDAFQWRLEP